MDKQIQQWASDLRKQADILYANIINGNSLTDKQALTALYDIISDMFLTQRTDS